MCLFLFCLNYITPSQDSACIKMYWSNKNVPFPPFVCESKHKTKQDHYVDHDACISHISLSLQSKCLGKQNKTKQQSAFRCKKEWWYWKTIGGIFCILCEKGQNLQVKKQKKMCNFCAEHTAVIPILVIMTIFSFFSNTITWLAFQAMHYQWIPAW